MIREDQLVSYLEEGGGTLKSADLQRRMSLSANTVRATVKIINLNSRKNGFYIVHVKNEGYRLVIEQEALFAQYKKSVENSIDLTRAEDRRDALLYYLLQEEDFVTLDELAERLEISRTTLKKDLRETEGILQGYQLELKSKSHYGIKICGREEDIRRALTRYVMESRLYVEPINKYRAFFDKIDNPSFKNRLHEIITENGLIISDLAFENLFIHYAVLLYRITQNNRILLGNTREGKTNSVYVGIARAIAEQTKKTLGIEIPDQEIEYFALNLQSKAVAEALPEELKEELEEKIRQLLKQLDLEFNMDFAEDRELICNLLLHVYPLIHRMSYDFQLKNPIIDEISMGYINVFTVALRFAELLSRQFSIPDLSRDEIGFITLHFAANFERRKTAELNKIKKIIVICATGGGSAALMKIKLENVFANAEITTISEYDVAGFSGELPDLFLSMIPFTGSIRGVPVIRMKQFLNEEELNRIKDITALKVAYQDTHKDKGKGSWEMTPLFDEKYYQILQEGDYMEIIRLQAQQMADDGAASPEYPDYVLQREKKYPTIFMNGIATPHPIRLNAVRNTIGVTMLRRPIFYEGKEIRMIFLINLEADGLLLHQEIQRLMLKLIENDGMRERVWKADSFDDFMKEIQKIV